MRTLTVLLTILLAAPAGAQAPPQRLAPGAHHLKLTVAGRAREYRVYVPKGHDVSRPAPLVLMFHGGGGNSRSTMKETGWAATADAQGFVVAFPDGIRQDPSSPPRFRGNGQSWNDGSTRTSLVAVAQGVDDVAYVRALLAHLKARVAVDPRRIYATGFSNGASMTFRLGHELSDVFAAIAPVAGCDWPGQPAPTRALPLLVITGDADPLNPVAGGPVRIGRKSYGTKRPVQQYLDEWVAALGCATTPEVVRDAGGVRTVRYTGGKGGAEVRYVRLAGHGHHWPGGKSQLPAFLAGPHRTSLKANDEIWAFFRRFALPETPRETPGAD